MNQESIISKVWSFCTTLRDDGVGYGDYLEQATEHRAAHPLDVEIYRMCRRGRAG